MPGQAATGAISAGGYALETTAGTYLAPTNWLGLETDALDSDYDNVKKKLMAGTRASGRIKRSTLAKPEGPLSWPLMATNGAKLFKASLGADSYQAALTADTVKAATPIVTANGISTITVTNTATVTYVINAPVVVGTGLTSECRPILGISGNGALGTVLTVPALIKQAAASAGTAVVQQQGHLMTTTPTSATLPSLSYEDNQGGIFAYRYAGLYVDKLDLKAGKDLINCTATLFGTVKATGPFAPTTPAPSPAELTDLLSPLSIVEGALVGYGGAQGQATASYAGAFAGSSTAGIQLLPGIETWDLSWMNELIKKPCYNLKGAYRAFPGEQDLTFKYTMINEALREAEWDDYISQLQGVSAPLWAFAYLNTSVTSTAAWVGCSFYMPAMVYLTSKKIKSAGDTIGVTIDMEAVEVSASGDMLKAWIANSDLSGY